MERGVLAETRNTEREEGREGWGKTEGEGERGKGREEEGVPVLGSFRAGEEALSLTSAFPAPLISLQHMSKSGRVKP